MPGADATERSSQSGRSTPANEGFPFEDRMSAPRSERHRYLVLPGVDGRTRSAKAYRALFAAFEREVGHELSPFERSLLHAAVTLAFKSAAMQAAIIRGEPVDPDDLVRLSSEARRLVDNIKASSAKHNEPHPTLTDYLARKAAERPSGEAA